ncbi:UNVERIFIED_CONTAM: hypothetical protein Scaly_2112800 [Sesamum calycinum]|uniref:Uncharacterized protein n=1 Tax=Sesamum calycinum TaxID=2727403 RepID=A0AAW2MMW7_9LAMI
MLMKVTLQLRDANMTAIRKNGIKFPVPLGRKTRSLLELELIGIKASKCISKLILGPTPPKGTIIEYQKQLGLWATKLGSADSIVVRRMLAALTGNPHGLPGVSKTLDGSGRKDLLRMKWCGLLVRGLQGNKKPDTEDRDNLPKGGVFTPGLYLAQQTSKHESKRMESLLTSFRRTPFLLSLIVSI